jgi:nuclear pore complex protein Nup210
LIEGIRTGSAKVKVRVMGDSYQNVKPSEIVLHVIANLGLIPSNDVYLLRGSKLEFRAEMARQGPRVPLTLPSPQYYLEVLDPSIAKLDEKISEIEAIKEGYTSLLLRDRNVDTSDSSRQPTTDIHVMRPSYLTIHVTPGENFALCEFTSYIITFTVHDDWHHKLYSADNLIFKVNFPSRFFHINESSTNGTFHVVRTINSGNCKVLELLKSILDVFYILNLKLSDNGSTSGRRNCFISCSCRTFSRSDNISNTGIDSNFNSVAMDSSCEALVYGICERKRSH